MQIPMQQHPCHMPRATPAKQLIIQPPNKGNQEARNAQLYNHGDKAGASNPRMTIIKHLELKPQDKLHKKGRKEKLIPTM